MTQITPATVGPAAADQVAAALHERLAATIDMALTLKHIHWNVVGPDFIAVHEMLDEHVAEIRNMSDAIAERIRVLGGQPVGTPAALVKIRDWNDYKLAKALVPEHLKALHAAYAGVIADHRAVAAKVAENDPVTEDLLIGQLGTLELYAWFVRSFLEKSEAFDPPSAGSELTPEQAKAADEGKENVDIDSVGENYREAVETGANVKGEGQITP